MTIHGTSAHVLLRLFLRPTRPYSLPPIPDSVHRRRIDDPSYGPRQSIQPCQFSYTSLRSLPMAAWTLEPSARCPAPARQQWIPVWDNLLSSPIAKCNYIGWAPAAASHSSKRSASLVSDLGPQT